MKNIEDAPPLTEAEAEAALMEPLLEGFKRELDNAARAHWNDAVEACATAAEAYVRQAVGHYSAYVVGVGSAVRAIKK